MSGFTKLFNSILHSTIWSEPDHVRITWITMLAMADKYGDVQASVPGLARMAGKSLEEVEDALQRFQSPDPYSRTPDNGGRRVEVIEGGFHLLNHGKYRELMSVEERKEYNRKKQAERRARLRLSSSVNDSQLHVRDNQQSKHIAEAEAKADTEELKKSNEASASVPEGTIEGYSPFIEKVWRMTPKHGRERSSKKKLDSAWRKSRNRPSEESITDALQAWINSSSWTDQNGKFVPGIHLWISDRKWESLPEAKTSTLDKQTTFDENYERIE